MGRGERNICREAGIELVDEPAPLFQLLVLAQLADKPASSAVAATAARALFGAGLTTPRRMEDARWNQLDRILERVDYKRFDVSTPTRLGRNATLLLDRYAGDLRKLGEESDHDPAAAARLLQQFTGVGPAGADLFLREVQRTWSWVRPRYQQVG